MSDFTYRVRIPYYYTDRSGVIHHSNFFKLFEDARTEFFRRLGISYSEVEKQGYMLVVTDARCRYISNTGYDKQVEIKVIVSDVGKATIILLYEVAVDGKKLAEGMTKLGCVDENTAPRRLPANIAAVLKERTCNPKT